MGLCGLEEQNAPGAQIEVRTPARYRAQSICDRTFDGDATNRRKSIHLPIADQWPPVRVTAFSLGSHSQTRRSHGCALARSASLVRELSGQPRRVALCRAMAAWPPARTDHAALRASDSGNADGCG